MVTRIVISIVVGIVTAFVFWVVGTLISSFAPQIAAILIAASYPAGIIAAILWFFSGHTVTNIL